MRLDGLIKVLEELPASLVVRLDFGNMSDGTYRKVYVRGLDSWRGSYEQLTLAHAVYEGDRHITAGDLWEDAKDALAGRVFHGYKGGEYTMRAHTPIWADPYGEANCHGIAGYWMDGDEFVFSTMNVADYVY